MGTEGAEAQVGTSMMGGTAAKSLEEEEEKDRVIRAVLMLKLRANIPRASPDFRY